MNFNFEGTTGEDFFGIQPDISGDSNEGKGWGWVMIMLIIALIFAVTLCTGCSSKRLMFSEKYGYQREPFKQYTGKKRKDRNPPMIRMFPMSYYAQTPNP